MPIKTAVWFALILPVCLLVACKKESKNADSKQAKASAPMGSQALSEAELQKFGREMQATFAATNKAILRQAGKIDCDKSAPRYAAAYVKYGHVMQRMARMGANEKGQKWMNAWKKKNESLVQTYQQNSRQLAVDCRGNAAFKKHMRAAVKKLKAQGVPLRRKQ